jgi:hypothetical protein
VVESAAEVSDAVDERPVGEAPGESKDTPTDPATRHTIEAD